MTMIGFHLGPHCGSRMVNTLHCERSTTLRSIFSVMQLGGMMKLRNVPNVHKSARLGRHFSWTVHWHQEQRKSER